ncbi:MAG: rRNA maturation RNase YbeY [Candidatus Levybacteria bacterium]|nr:rRNA maturation RNase YbeY [Candidatus Levybacteria bacterium]
MHNDVKVLIYVESRYKADRKRIKRVIQDVLSEVGVKSAVEISVAIVGDRKMRSLNNKYRGKDATTNVLSFPLKEGTAANLPSDINRLGDIVLSYPQVIRDASRDEMLVDEKIEELIRHGMQHLLGMHHG